MNAQLQALNLRPSGNSLEAYMSYVNRLPLLSQQEEQALAVSLRDQNDLEAARQLVLSHARYVVKIAKGYLGYGLPLGDLVQEGNIGLMKAVKRFDPQLNVRLVTFAVHWIKSEIHEFILRNWRIVKIATTKAQRKLFFNLRTMKKRLGWFTHEEVNDVAKNLGVKPETVREMEMRLSNADVSFDRETEDEDHHDKAGYLPAPVEYLQDAHSNPAELLENHNWEEKSNTVLHQVMGQLDDRSQKILKARWLADKKATLEDLAAKHQVSAERIRQIEKNALEKLKTLIQLAG
jgi:RNA polymerase sigma-32 factor